MKRIFRFGVILSFVLLMGASLVPGPPERFRDWPSIGEGEAQCRDGRTLAMHGFAAKENYSYVGFIIFSDTKGPFVWLFYTDKNEPSNIRTGWVFDGIKFWQFDSIEELSATFGPTPCDIPRPAPLKAL